MKKPILHTGDKLWEQFLAGDKSAFSELYKSYVSDLYLFGLRLSQNQELVKDGVQELFISLWDKRETLPIVRNVKSYLITSLRNSLLRKISNSQKTSVFKIEEFLQNADVNHITNQTEKELLARQLKKKIDQLPQRQKEVLHLRYYQNMSITDISEIMNMKYQSVSNLLGRAIEKMKNTWAKTKYHHSKKH